MGKNVTNKNSAIQGPHYAIITFKSMHIPGDERSRTNPGHGYPAYDAPYVEYEAFDDGDVEGWEARIMYLTERKTPYQAMRVIPATVKMNVTVEVNDG